MRDPLSADLSGAPETGGNATHEKRETRLPWGEKGKAVGTPFRRALWHGGGAVEGKGGACSL